MPRRRGKAVATVCAFLVVGLTAAQGQYFEDRMEPREIGIVDIDSLAAPRWAYVGNDSCTACHPDAYRIWLGTKHARSTVPLRSRMAMRVGEKDSITAEDPALSGKCLSCHATAHDVPALFRGPGVRMGEGVTCEGCHGPGEKHVKDMNVLPRRVAALLRMMVYGMVRKIDGEADTSADLEMPREQGCLNCHKPKQSHEANGAQAFSYAPAWKQIAHPE